MFNLQCLYIHLHISVHSNRKKNKQLNKPTIAIFDLNIKIHDKKITIKMTVLQHK